MHHAWSINRQGQAIDNTWEASGTEYFGIPIKLRVLNDIAAGSGFDLFRAIQKHIREGRPLDDIVQPLEKWIHGEEAGES